MASERPDEVRDLLSGPLASIGASWPLFFHAAIGSLRDGFLNKSGLGSGTRVVGRNGRVLLASRRPLDDLVGRMACVRLQTWHRAIFRGDRPQPWGILIWLGDAPATTACYEVSAQRTPVVESELTIELGGMRYLTWISSATSR